MSQRDLDRYTALSTAGVHKTFVISPRELQGQRLSDAHAEASHGAQELFQSRGFRVNLSEKVLSLFSLVLWLAAFETGGQVAPKTVKACVAHFQNAADIARLGAVEE
jgi:hypothetical protein